MRLLESLTVFKSFWGFERGSESFGKFSKIVTFCLTRARDLWRWPCFITGCFSLYSQTLRDATQESMEELRIFASQNSVYTDPESGVKVYITALQGGDMKYLLILYGLSQATANFPCLFCLVKKTDFHTGKLLGTRLRFTRNVHYILLCQYRLICYVQPTRWLHAFFY